MRKPVSRYLLVTVAVALPATLLVYSMLTFRELSRMQDLYLRNLAATVAARLEAIPSGQLCGDILEALAAEEPALVDVRIYSENESGKSNTALDAIWSGRELFRTESLTSGDQELFRVYLPFHSGSRLHVARIDLAASAAEFLVVHARHNVLLALASGAVLIGLSLYVLRTARKRGEMQHLAHLGQLSAILAHEIRNPLGTIKGFAQLAGEQGGPAIRPLLTPILEETHRLERLVNDLLLYGRPQEPRLRMADWPALASELEAHLLQAIGDRPIHFLNDAPSFTIRTDPDLLKAALLNLLRNALEAVTEQASGEVRLRVAEQKNGLVISVEDNGPGIPESMHSKLFQPFFTTKASGTGLGLSIARKLVELLGGTVVLSALEPRGTRVELRFPEIELKPGVIVEQSAWKASS